MIMPREKREILKEDIMSLDVYTEKRRELRKNIVDFKKNRRIALGPYATFYFESFETMLAQVQEMLYIEKGGEEQLKDELVAYNPLIPNGKELSATLILRPFNFDTLAINVYQYASDEMLGEAATGSLIIVTIGLLPVIILSKLISDSRKLSR